MSKFLFTAPVMLKPGLNGADLEKFWVEEYLPNVSELPGWRQTLSKGTAGVRKDQYLLQGHFESEERFAELYPEMGDATSEEWQQWLAANPVQQKLLSCFDENWHNEVTQYAEL